MREEWPAYGPVLMNRIRRPNRAQQPDGSRDRFSGERKSILGPPFDPEPSVSRHTGIRTIPIGVQRDNLLNLYNSRTIVPSWRVRFAQRLFHS
jgi:hypothetical protein